MCMDRLFSQMDSPAWPMSYSCGETRDPVERAFLALMEADAVVRPSLLAAWRSVDPILAAGIERLWRQAEVSDLNDADALD